MDRLRELLAEAERAVASGSEPNMTQEDKEALASMSKKLTEELRDG